MTKPVRRQQTRVFIAMAIVAGSMSLTFVGLHYFQLSHSAANKTVTPAITVKSKPITTPKEPTEHVYSLPSRLVITKLGINAHILSMGLTATGAMEAPKTNEDAGWLKNSAQPGNKGSAVIDGHLGLKNEAVFGTLAQLTAGDEIAVTDTQGAVAKFVVRQVQIYSKADPAADVFNSKSGSHLNLITCNGDWESSQATYSKRLVVFSDKITE